MNSSRPWPVISSVAAATDLTLWEASSDALATVNATVPEVESALVSHPAVLEAAVTPRDEGGLLRPQAHVVLTQGRQASPELAEELRKRRAGPAE